MIAEVIYYSIRFVCVDMLRTTCQLPLFIVCIAAQYLYAGGPCIVTVDTGAASGEWNNYSLAVVADLQCEDMIDARDLERLAEEPYYKVQNAEGFRSDTGTARFFDDSGQLRSLRFWTVSSPEVYAEFVEFLLEQRGSTARVTGSETQKCITVPSPPAVVGEPHISWVDVFVSYSNGVILLGSSNAVFSFDAAALSKLLKQHPNKDWQFHLIPDAVPNGVREAFLRQTLLQAGVGLQRRDNEATEDYAKRRLLIEGLEIITRSSLLDLERLSASTAWPRENRPFQCRVEIHAKKDTALAADLSSLRTNRETIRLIPRTESIGRISICVSIPERFQKPLNTFLLGIQEELPDLVQLLGAVTKRQIEAVAELHETDEGVPVLSGGVRLNGKCPAEESVARAAKADLTSAGIIHRILTPEYDEKWLPSQQLALTLTDSILRFAISKNIVPPNNDQVKFSDGSRDSGQLLQLHLDLATWVTRTNDSEASTLITGFESAFQRWLVFRRSGEFLKMRNREHLVGTNFRSLTRNSTSEGDWKLNLSVRSSSDAVTFNCEVGRDLHRLVVAHQLAARAEINRLRNVTSTKGQD